MCLTLPVARFNEELRRTERRLRFDVDALANAICLSVNRPLTDLAAIAKLTEGGFNRVLQAIFNDDYTIIARLPYRITVPKHYAVASEAATLDFLRSQGIAVPKVLGYSSVKTNPISVEYLLLEKLDGTPLGDQWFTMDTTTRVRMMRQIVDLEEKLLNIPLPASGNQIVVGPTAQFEWWYRERALLNVDRGPCVLQQNVKSSFFKKISPPEHIRHLSNYLKLTPHLDIPPSHRFSRPVLRHPDFSPNNILVNSSGKIHFQNWGDPLSETLAKPEVKLPDNFQALGREEQRTIQETMRRRIVHFYYAALTMRHLPDHFDALRNENAMLRAKLFERAGAPWEGDSLSLKYAITQARRNWPMTLPGDKDKAEHIECPVTYSEEETRQCVDEHSREVEKIQELDEMRELIGTDALG
ncbi:hypothetical protein ACJ73_07308 [Blastomyces percursus]|uniref:Aminoglycoside phosphotransferase domain-containing protein n=1 Tax=Blastomyces percursus TaxID=1658174 RepID=A0A1J9PYF7_9EURO|nr:hypothetical protein ACJ73_07308 [Blastomyces percursus]